MNASYLLRVHPVFPLEMFFSSLTYSQTSCGALKGAATLFWKDCNWKIFNFVELSEESKLHKTPKSKYFRNSQFNLPSEAKKIKI